MADEAERAVRLAMAAERKRLWQQQKQDDVSITVATSNRVDQASVAFRAKDDEIHTFAKGRRSYARSDVPMLVQTFRRATEEWEIMEALAAANTLVDTTVENRRVIIEAGMLRAVCERLSELSSDAQKLCLKFLASLAKCSMCHDSFAMDNTSLALFALEKLKSVLIGCDGGLEDAHLLMTILAAVTSSSNILNIFMRCDEDQSSNTSVIMSVVRRAGIEVVALEKRNRVEVAMKTIQYGFLTLENIATFGPESCCVLRRLSAVPLCLDALTVIHSFMSRNKSETVGTLALSAAVAAHCRIAVLDDGEVDDETINGMSAVYETLRSQLAMSDIQVQGFRLMTVLANTEAGAKKLDTMNGAWQWLGQHNLHFDEAVGKYN